MSTPLNRSLPTPKLSAHESSIVDALRTEFDAFRSAHPRGTHVPKRLCSGVANALEEGIAMGVLHAACGISWGQGQRWQAAARKGRIAENSTAKTSATEAQVFTVREPVAEQTAPPAPANLELRMGQWSVSIRLADTATAS